MRSPAGSGTGQEKPVRSLVSSLGTISECNVVAPVLIVGGTRTFRRNHRSSQRLFGRATRTKRRTIRWFLQPQQNICADAFTGLFRADVREIEASFGIEDGELFLQLQAALWNRANAAPFPVRDLKHERNRFQIGRASCR